MTSIPLSTASDTGITSPVLGFWKVPFSLSMRLLSKAWVSSTLNGDIGYGKDIMKPSLIAFSTGILTPVIGCKISLVTGSTKPRLSATGNVMPAGGSPVTELSWGLPSNSFKSCAAVKRSTEPLGVLTNDLSSSIQPLAMASSSVTLMPLDGSTIFDKGSTISHTIASRNDRCVPVSGCTIFLASGSISPCSNKPGTDRLRAMGMRRRPAGPAGSSIPRSMASLMVKTSPLWGSNIAPLFPSSLLQLTASAKLKLSPSEPVKISGFSKMSAVSLSIIPVSTASRGFTIFLRIFCRTTGFASRSGLWEKDLARPIATLYFGSVVTRPRVRSPADGRSSSSSSSSGIAVVLSVLTGPPLSTPSSAAAINCFKSSGVRRPFSTACWAVISLPVAGSWITTDVDTISVFVVTTCSGEVPSTKCSVAASKLRKVSSSMRPRS